MAHELTERADGTVEFAFTGPRSGIWHGLGAEMEENADFDTWKERAGLDWTVEEQPVRFMDQGESRMFPDRKVLMRSDNRLPLSIVSDNFKVVQPGEVIDFFSDLVELHGMKLSTAGTLFEGKRFWALAEVGKEFSVVDGDSVEAHLLLTTAVDGSMATTAKFVATRVVCNNTMTVGLGERGTMPAVKVTHHRQFDPDAVKIDLNILDQAWVRTMNNLRKLADVKMDERQTRRFYEEQFYDPTKLSDEQPWGAVRMVNRLMEFATKGSGSDMSSGTAWGALCGATEFFTHGMPDSKRNASHKFWESYCGDLELKKRSMYQNLTAMVA